MEQHQQTNMELALNHPPQCPFESGKTIGLDLALDFGQNFLDDRLDLNQDLDWIWIEIGLDLDWTGLNLDWTGLKSDWIWIGLH